MVVFGTFIAGMLVLMVAHPTHHVQLSPVVPNAIPTATPISSVITSSLPTQPIIAELSPAALRFGWCLVRPNGRGSTATLTSNPLQGVKYVALYFSASWCPPCQAFTPRLVSFYYRVHQRHPEFEVILASCDQSESDMVAYMNHDGMEWPAFDFNQRLGSRLGLGEFSGKFIPTLVLIDKNCRVLADSKVSGQSPDSVLERINELLR